MITLNFFTVYFLVVSFVLLIVVAIDRFDIKKDEESWRVLFDYTNTKDEFLADALVVLMEVEFPVRSYSASSQGEQHALEELLIRLKQLEEPQNRDRLRNA